MADEKQKRNSNQDPTTDDIKSSSSLGPLYLALFTGAFMLLGDTFDVFMMWQAKARFGVALLMTALTMALSKDPRMRVYCGSIIWGSLILTFWL